MLRALGVLLLAAFASVAALAQTPTWIEFRPEGAGYSIEMPGEWTLTSEDVPTAIGPLKATLAQVNIGQRAFMTMYIRYPEEAIRNRPVTQVLDGARDGAVANVKGKLRSDERVVVSDLPAREIIIDAPSNLVVVSRYFLMGVTLVQALVAGARDVEKDPDTRRFLNSLKVIR